MTPIISRFWGRAGRLGRHMVLLGGVLAGLGCGVEGVGIRSIKFNLQPAFTGTHPSAYDTGLALMASGRVEVDVIAGTGFVAAYGLPAPPDQFVYEVELIFAKRENTDIPGIPNPSASAMALADAATAQVVSIYFGDNLLIGNMMPMIGGDMWHLPFSAADVGAPLGAVRAATIYLAPTISIPMIGGVLYGQVGSDPGGTPVSSDGHVGHTHGV